MQKIVISFLIISVFLSLSYYKLYSNNVLEVYYYDIGQGDSTMIKTPDNRYILIDVGLDITTMGRLGETMPYWINKIDIVIITHAHADHMAGLINLLNRIEIGTLVYNRQFSKSGALTNYIEELIEENKTEVISINSENDFYVGCCVYVDILWPNPQILFSTHDLNDSSISLLIQYKNFNSLFTGDLPQKYEEVIMHDINVDVDFLQVGHHGSKTSTSSSFIKKITPDFAIISCGLQNKFGHPHKDTIDTLDENNVKIYRTDLQGTVKVVYDGNEIKISTAK
jgi:competence protein ComEC